MAQQPKRKIGSIEPAGPGVWRVRVSRGSRSDGGRRTVNETVYGTYEDADIACARIASEMGATVSYGDSLTLSQYYHGIFRLAPSNRGTKRSNVTLKGYDSQMERFVLPLIGDKPISSIKHSDIKQAVLSSTSPSKCKTVLRAVMRAAYDDDLVPEMPMTRRIVTPQRHREQTRPWDAMEAVRELAALQGSGAPEVICILGLSGFRYEEVLGIAPGNIQAQQTFDIGTGETLTSLTATITQTYTDEDGLKSKAKTDFSMRSMPVLVQGRERLLQIIAEGRPSDPADVAEWAATRLVPYTSDKARKLWRAAVEGAGLRYIPPDMLRHTSETLMQAASLPDTLVSRLHGHTDLKTDYKHYLRPDASAAERAAREVHKIMPTSGL